ncbi:hybrid sensor histidine kinase/response regulator [Ectothiorhodospiraceae bacterium BW-2]|nr:hybrid sensor histidine kinase/response regulator [Ectothiorhodospiraceae bacterium BW-2]
MSTTPHKPKILIVDDTPENLDLTGEILSPLYQVLVAINGDIGLAIAAKSQPDLILLDVMMPGKDGYVVCEQLKQNPITCHIPIIFLTALSSINDEACGLQLGAVDFITKPFSGDILKARIATHLEKARLITKLQQLNTTLEQNILMREIVESINRHDLKGPLNILLHYPRLITRHEPQLSEKSQLFLQAMESSAQQMLQLIDISLDILKIEQGTYHLEAKSIPLLPLLDKVLQESKTLIRYRKIRALICHNGQVLEQDQFRFDIKGDELLLHNLFSNLIRNAFEAAPDNSTLTIDLKPATPAHPSHAITLSNSGAVPSPIRAKFFEKMVTHGKRSGTGLGTYSAALSVRAMAGTIALEVDDSRDLTHIHITLPAAHHKL